MSHDPSEIILICWIIISVAGLICCFINRETIVLLNVFFGPCVTFFFDSLINKKLKRTAYTGHYVVRFWKTSCSWACGNPTVADKLEQTGTKHFHWVWTLNFRTLLTTDDLLNHWNGSCHSCVGVWFAIMRCHSDSVLPHLTEVLKLLKRLE